jgi:disulfide bond formation protein DsbB
MRNKHFKNLISHLSKIRTIKTNLRGLNILEILGIQSILIFALVFQIFLKDLPCPLCLLQRIGFFGIAIGLLMNLRFGLHPSHYAMALLSALFTSFVALRQIVLHIVPGTGKYGLPFLGLHLYTWSFIAAMMIIIFTSLILSIDRQYDNHLATRMRSHWSTYTLLAFTTLLVIINVVSLLIQCGISECPAK